MLRGEGDFQDALLTTPKGSGIIFLLAVSPVKAQTTSLCNDVSVLPSLMPEVRVRSEGPALQVTLGSALWQGTHTSQDF